MNNIYGQCPMCNAPGVTRENIPGGSDTCKNGHVYFSSTAVNQPADIVSKLEGAMDILRKAMEDKTEGELYHTWRIGIKYCMYDAILHEIEKPEPDFSMKQLSEACDNGAEAFLNELLKEK
ncbi:MAG: hypothetical protein GY829_13545 [Gammaproteobacteria bacterium]|nr:hypothetical protein [Gammaproteobacteria bacterium]